MPEEEIKKQLDMQARRLLGGGEWQTEELVEDVVVEDEQAALELEKQAQDRIRMYGEDSTA